MSRNLIPAVLTIGVGIYSGYYIFQPAFQELAIERAHGGSSSSSPKAHPSENEANSSGSASIDTKQLAPQLSGNEKNQ